MVFMPFMVTAFRAWILGSRPRMTTKTINPFVSFVPFVTFVLRAFHLPWILGARPGMTAKTINTFASFVPFVTFVLKAFRLTWILWLRPGMTASLNEGLQDSRSAAGNKALLS